MLGYTRPMRFLERIGRAILILTVFGIASYFSMRSGTGGLWRGLESAHPVPAPGQPEAPWHPTQLVGVNETRNPIRTKYVAPIRVKPRQMFLSALNEIQREV